MIILNQNNQVIHNRQNQTIARCMMKVMLVAINKDMKMVE